MRNREQLRTVRKPSGLLPHAVAALGLVMSVYSAAVAATALGDAVAQTPVGGWKLLNSAGDGSGWSTSLLDAGGGHSILQYSDKGKWDPNTKRVLYVGKGAGANLQKFISYSDASGTWSIEPKPYWDCTPSDSCLGHAYHHNTIDPSGNLYYHLYYSTDYFILTRATGQWSQLPAPSGIIACCIGLEYFPEMRGGGLVAVGDGAVHFFNSSTNQWSQLTSGLAMGPYHNVALYNAVHKIVLFGGGNGSSDLYKIDAAGKITKIANAPANVGIAASVITVDPVSGKYLLLSSARGFYQYDVLADSWSPLNASTVPVFPPDGQSDFNFYGTVAVPISTYGVILFMKYEDGQSKVYLYKHTASVPDTTPPAPPRNLSVK
jgi:hypothetical protein